MFGLIKVGADKADFIKWYSAIKDAMDKVIIDPKCVAEIEKNNQYFMTIASLAMAALQAGMKKTNNAEEV